LKNAADLSDPADAVIALGKIKRDEEVVAALGDALRNDKAWESRHRRRHARRARASRTLRSCCSKQPIRTMAPGFAAAWSRRLAISKTTQQSQQNSTPQQKRTAPIALAPLPCRDWRASRRQTPWARLKLRSVRIPAAASCATPHFALSARSADDKAVPLLLEWSSVGRPVESRTAAIYSLARLQKDNKEITKQIVSYLTEPRHPIRMASIYALGSRGDASAIQRSKLS